MMHVEINKSDRPMCPGTFAPVHPLHQLHVNLQDILREAIPENPETLESIDPSHDDLYAAVAYDRYDGYMNLYKNVVTVIGRHAKGAFVIIESWYFRCGTCGLILPAQEKPDAR